LQLTWFFEVDEIFVIRMFRERDDVGVDVGAAELEQRGNSEDVALAIFIGQFLLKWTC